MAEFVMKHGDTLPILSATLFYDENLTEPVDLTNATQVIIKVGKGDTQTPPYISKAMTIDAVPSTGKVRYQFVLADWQSINPGNHSIEFEVTWGSGDVSTFPKTGYVRFVVNADLDID